MNGDGEIVVGIQQSQRARHDAMAVCVGVVGEGDIESVLQLHQPGHRVWARAVHANLAVVIEGHETEARVHHRVDNSDIQAVDLVDRLPVVHAGAAKRIDRHAHTGRSDPIDIDDTPQVRYVRRHEVVIARRPRLCRGRIGHSPDLTVAAEHEGVSPFLDPRRHALIGRTAMRGVVLETAVARRVMRRRDHDAVRECPLAAAVVSEDRVGDHGRGCYAIAALNQRLDAIRGQHFERGALCRT